MDGPREFTRPTPLATHPDGVPWRRYVALGDSFTEGLWDLPDADVAADGPPSDADPRACRGWADLLALHLAARHDQPDGVARSARPYR